MKGFISNSVVILLLGSLAVQVQAQVTSSRVMSNPGNVIEAESLLSQAKASAGDLTIQNMSGFGPQWGQGSQLFWHVPALGDRAPRDWSRLTLPLQVSADGSYEITLFFTGAPDFGNVRVSLRGVEAGDYMGYAPSVILQPFPLGQHALAAGSNPLVLTVFGKQSESTNYLVGLDRIEVEPAMVPMPAGQSRAGGSSVRSQPLNASAPLVAAAAGSQASTRAGRSPSGGAQSAGPDCDSTCMGNVATVYRKNDGGNCETWFRFACAPYNCDEAAGLCRAFCQSDAECAQGSQCDTTTGMCAMVSARCVDSTTVKMPNGQTESCTPYKCLGGSCRNVCATKNDCTSGFSCNTSAAACLKSSQ